MRPVDLSGKTTGGHFSQGYIVENTDGRQGFLKALDYSRALRSKDPARALQAMTAAFNFERDILEECGQKNLSRIIRAIGAGKVHLDPQLPETLVEYLVFERHCCTARSKSLTSLCRLQSHPAQYVSGIPSAAILLSISHPIRCSTRCLANVRARISGPMIAL